MCVCTSENTYEDLFFYDNKIVIIAINIIIKLDVIDLYNFTINDFYLFYRYFYVSIIPFFSVGRHYLSYLPLVFSAHLFH